MTAAESIGRTHRRTVSYIDKSREFYAAHGYERAYEWASYQTVPFVPWVTKGLELANATVGVVTTSFPVGAPMPKQVYAQASSPTPESMFTKDLSWHKSATHTDDVGSFLPLGVLDKLRADGVIGSASARFYGVPTQHSQRRTAEAAARVVEWASADGVDAMVLVGL